MTDTTDTTSTIERITYRGRESRACVLTADNASLYRNADTGELCIALHRYSEAGKPLETYEFRLCLQDQQRLAREFKAGLGIALILS